MSTASLEGARDHARSQDGAAAPTQRTVPAGDGGGPPAGRRGRRRRVGRDARGRQLRHGRAAAPAPSCASPTPTGDACVHLVVHHARATAERLNVADTVKVQWQAYLGPGAVLLSDMGRAMMTIVADTSGRHDALCGATSAAVARQRYGQSGIHSATPDRPRAAHRRRRQARPRRRATCRPASTCSSRRPSRADGALRFDGAPRAGHGSRPARRDGRRRDARQRARTRSTTRPAYTSSTVRVTAWRGRRTAADDPLRASSPERRRAYENTDELPGGAAMTLTAPCRRRRRRGTRRLVRRRRRRPDAAHRRPRRQPGRRLPALRRPRHRRALLGRRHDRRPGQHLPRRRHGAALQRGRADDDDRRHDVRPPRHDRRGLQPGVEHAALRPPHPPPARLRRELPRRGRPPRARQARPRLEHQLVHERARRRRRHARHRRRHLGTGPVRSTSAPRSTCSC